MRLRVGQGGRGTNHAYIYACMQCQRIIPSSPKHVVLSNAGLVLQANRLSNSPALLIWLKTCLCLLALTVYCVVLFTAAAAAVRFESRPPARQPGSSVSFQFACIFSLCVLFRIPFLLLLLFLSFWLIYYSP